MKLTPAARTAMQTWPGPGARSLETPSQRTSGPPWERTRMARVTPPKVACRPVRLPALAALLAVALGLTLAARADESSTLTFRAADGKETALTKAQLRARCGVVTVS